MFASSHLRLCSVLAATAAVGAVVAGGLSLASPAGAAAPVVVGAAAVPSGTGWWTVTNEGAVTASGSAQSYGDVAATHLNQPIVSIASTPDGRGYWLLARDGGIFTFGDARFFGSTGNLRLNQPITGMASTTSGNGYWLVARDGGIFTFGDARFFGSTGALQLNRPITGMAPSADGSGYWLVASDGGVFTFGSAHFYGSTGAMRLPAPIVGMAATADRGGYWVLGANGAVYAFGDATFAGSSSATSFGITATSGGGYTVRTASGPQHFGPPIAPASSPSAPPAGLVAPPAAPARPGLPASAPRAAGPANPAGARSATIGSAVTPQVVRVGASLREVDPSAPGQYLPGDFKFVGVDAYEATTDWPSANNGCGFSLPNGQLTRLFKSLGPDAVVRTWFFQTLDMNQYDGSINWAPFDQVVAQANQAGVHLIATLGNQDGSCDDGVWKDPTWYTSGFKAVAPGQHYSFEQWAQMITARYKSNPAILAWEPINEPRPDTCAVSADCWDHRTCVGDALANTSLRSFYDVIGADIRTSDPNHLISDGAPPVVGCGTATWADMLMLEASPGIDLMSFHDYNGGGSYAASDVASWSAVSAAVAKPLFAGENGGVTASDDAHPSASCPTQTQRGLLYATKVAGEFRAMSFFTGWLLWDALPDSFVSCDYATWIGDPILSDLAEVASVARSAR